jgi:hypothetical protein
MKRFALLSAVMMFAIVGAAHADKPVHPSHPAHPAHPSPPNAGKSHACTPRNEGYNASGMLVSATLTPGTKKGHFDGTITADVTRANHRASTGSQTYTLTDARVQFGKGVSSTAPAPGSRIRLQGRSTVLPHGCPSTGFTPTTTIRHVEIKQAK